MRKTTHSSDEPKISGGMIFEGIRRVGLYCLIADRVYPKTKLVIFVIYNKVLEFYS